MQALPETGMMVAVSASETQVRAAIQNHPAVSIAAINSPFNSVISGEKAAVSAVAATLEADGVKTTPLIVSHAFHSPLMVPMLAEFAKVASEIRYSPPEIDFISNVTGKVITDEVTRPEYWVNHILQPVKFAASIETLYQQGYKLFIEICPKPTLLGMTRQCLPIENVFIPNGGMVGSLSVKSGFIIEFIVDSDPTLQIWGEKSSQNT